MKSIKINFLPFKNQDLGITVFRKKLESWVFQDNLSYYDFPNAFGKLEKYEIVLDPSPGYEEFKLPAYYKTGLISKTIVKNLENVNGLFRLSDNPEIFDRKLYKVLEDHPKGRKCIWIEPYFLKSKNIWGIQVGYRFIVNENLKTNGKFKLDKDILIASGSLNNKGLSNLDFYLFKHKWITFFIKNIVPEINNVSSYKISSDLFEIGSHLLKPKQYVFGNNNSSNSAYLGLTQNYPLEKIKNDLYFLFIYLKQDRDFAAALLKGLRGESFPNTFGGLEKVFKIPFTNEKIRGVSVDDFENSSLDVQISEIQKSDKATIPIIITLTKKDEESDELYFRLKHRFTKAGIPCQVVTKELIANEYSIKYSLSNIALQIFAKAGGTPWKMKPASNEYLIIGIGQSYNIERSSDGNSIEKNITYSVLTDSSGIFKDLQVLSEGVETDDSYYTKLVANISNIVINSGYKKVAIHVPFRLSKDKILKKVASNIGNQIEFTVLVINSKTDHFGFDYENNGLVPFESTFVKLASDEYLVWFEGLSAGNPKITKRFSNPLLISFWYTNNEKLFQNYDYKESLLQDCINLSGANWRGFKAKQLPVSIFYCQRIAEFIGKFREYNLDHIEINNLKPWFL